MMLSDISSKKNKPIKALVSFESTQNMQPFATKITWIEEIGRTIW